MERVHIQWNCRRPKNMRATLRIRGDLRRKIGVNGDRRLLWHRIRCLQPRITNGLVLIVHKGKKKMRILLMPKKQQINKNIHSGLKTGLPLSQVRLQRRRYWATYYQFGQTSSFQKLFCKYKTKYLWSATRGEIFTTGTTGRQQCKFFAGSVNFSRKQHIFFE